MAGALSLGPVMFYGFEVPARVRFGGKQRLAVHVLPGGGRVVDAMGADEGPIGWSGVFSGPGAPDRVRLLERLRRSGAAVLLSWEGWRYTVVIESFAAEPANPAWIPYKLKVCVVTAGDPIVAVLLPAIGTLAEAVVLGAGSNVDGQIDRAAGLLGSSDIATAITAAGALARLVTARAYIGTAAVVGS